MIRLTAFALAAIVLVPSSLSAQILTDKPNELIDVGIVEHRDQRLPLSTSFTDSSGNTVRLSEFFDGERPVILSFNYASCPMLCKLQLNGLVDGLRKLDWDAGDKFRVVSISIDPSETSQQAAASKQKHLNAYGRPGTGDGWEFLTGTPASIRTAAAAAGFKYKYVPATREYSHTAAVMVCTPDGRLSQYLYGVMYDESTLRLSLADATNGQVGSALDQLLLFCFSYDRMTGKYTPVAKNIMRVGALSTVFGLTICVAPFWFRLRSKSELRTAKLKGAS